MNSLITLWRFSRPHTIIGSVVSIVTLYFVVCTTPEAQCLEYLILALIIGVSCNIFIVGINQIADVDIDKINKPYLPIPAGELTILTAKIYVIVAISISLVTALYISIYLFCIIALAAIIGWAYSMPPCRLKQHHITAAFCIAMVRGVLLNAGGFLVFNYLVNGSLEMPENVKILTGFVIVFSIVISWFKDLPDVEGDAKYNIKTFAILYSPKVALISGHVLVGLAYMFTIFLKFVAYSNAAVPSFETKVLLYGHILLVVLFIANSFSIRLAEHRSVQKFYKRFWLFFFAEYLVYLIAYAF